MTNLRSKIIRLASSLPRGGDARHKLLAALKEADEADLGWATILKTKRFVEEDLEASEGYSRQVTLLKSLQAGDRVEIGYHDSQRAGYVKTVRVVSHSWDDLKMANPGGWQRPEVLLEPKVPGKRKSGMITDYGPEDGVVWQGAMLMPVREVITLRRT